MGGHFEYSGSYLAFSRLVAAATHAVAHFCLGIGRRIHGSLEVRPATESGAVDTNQAQGLPEPDRTFKMSLRRNARTPMTAWRWSPRRSRGIGKLVAAMGRLEGAQSATTTWFDGAAIKERMCGWNAAGYWNPCGYSVGAVPSTDRAPFFRHFLAVTPDTWSRQSAKYATGCAGPSASAFPTRSLALAWTPGGDGIELCARRRWNGGCCGGTRHLHAAQILTSQPELSSSPADTPLN